MELNVLAVDSAVAVQVSSLKVIKLTWLSRTSDKDIVVGIYDTVTC